MKIPPRGRQPLRHSPPPNGKLCLGAGVRPPGRSAHPVARRYQEPRCGLFTNGGRRWTPPLGRLESAVQAGGPGRGLRGRGGAGWPGRDEAARPRPGGAGPAAEAGPQGPGAGPGGPAGAGSPGWAGRVASWQARAWMRRPRPRPRRGGARGEGWGRPDWPAGPRRQRAEVAAARRAAASRVEP